VADQHWDPDRYARNARFVSDLGAPVLDLLAPRAGEHILDLGCGDGALTEALVAAGAHVVGVDASAEQVAACQARGLDAHVMDGTGLDFDDVFDAVFSNAALHWMRDLDAVVAGVRRALVPGGRFVGEMGGEGNVRAVAEALLAALNVRGIDGQAAWPWVFPSAEDFRHILERHGFVVEAIELFDRPTPLPGDLGDWLETFAAPFLDLVSEADRPALIAEVRAAAAGALQMPDGTWAVDYVRLRFCAQRNGSEGRWS